MADCASCALFTLESENSGCLHQNRPGGLELTAAALQTCHLPQGAVILDAACGAGSTLAWLVDEKGFTAIGLDLSPLMLQKAGKRKGNLLICAANSHIPLPSAGLDAILVECALSLSGSLAQILAEFYRVLKPGGWLVITDVYLREVLDPAALACLDSSACLSGVQNEDALRSQLKENGFNIQNWQDETTAYKGWLAGMVFKAGSLQAVYRQMAGCESDALELSQNIGKGFKLGYYRTTAQKSPVKHG
jgi:arsenite methyltransferase